MQIAVAGLPRWTMLPHKLSSGQLKVIPSFRYSVILYFVFYRLPVVPTLFFRDPPSIHLFSNISTCTLHDSFHTLHCKVVCTLAWHTFVVKPENCHVCVYMMQEFITIRVYNSHMVSIPAIWIGWPRQSAVNIVSYENTAVKRQSAVNIVSCENTAAKRWAFATVLTWLMYTST